MTTPRRGYTLPVFACAAAIAALRHLLHQPTDTVPVDLLDPDERVDIPVEQVARLTETSALAITRSDPGDNLDLTRHTPVWAMVELASGAAPGIRLEGGEGLGRLVHADFQAAIYAYARRLLQENLTPYLTDNDAVQVTLILPEGRALAERTSNAAFGVVEGLSLLGTSGIAQPLSAPGQLEEFQDELRHRGKGSPVVFCIGENGLDLAERMGIGRDRLFKTANWLGPMLVEAGLQGIPSVLLFGYHGKLLKLAGGIFHTHHFVADGRQEILAAHGAGVGMATPDVQTLFTSPTADAALHYLRQLDQTTESHWVNRVYGAIAHQIDQRSQVYIHAHSDRQVQVGSVLFDRNRQIVVQSDSGSSLMAQLLLS